MASQETDDFINQITNLYNKISNLKSLRPSKEVNALFEQHTTLCLPTNTNIEVNKMSQEIQIMRLNLIKLRGEAVGHLEKHFSKIWGSLLEDNPLNHIANFPTYNNYINLSKLESDLVINHMPHVPTKIAFVGSGPLPLSSILLAKSHLTNTTFHNFDIDQQANELASRLISRDLDLSKRIIFHTKDLFEMTKEVLSEYDVVFLAALVGLEKETKAKAIEHLEKHMAPGAILMLRSSHSLRSFLFHVVDFNDLKGFEVLSVYHPMSDEFLNSVVVARKLGGVKNGA